ncbi:MAG: hypothetical protein AAGK32_00025, partial [Actinomycetota bacterium]
LKRFMYSQLALRSAVMIALGKEEPFVTFTVEEDPPSVYLVFALRPERADDLKAEGDHHRRPQRELAVHEAFEGHPLAAVLPGQRVSSSHRRTVDRAPERTFP